MDHSKQHHISGRSNNSDNDGRLEYHYTCSFPQEKDGQPPQNVQPEEINKSIL